MLGPTRRKSARELATNCVGGRTPAGDLTAKAEVACASSDTNLPGLPPTTFGRTDGAHASAPLSSRHNVSPQPIPPRTGYSRDVPPKSPNTLYNQQYKYTLWVQRSASTYPGYFDQSAVRDAMSHTSELGIPQLAGPQVLPPLAHSAREYRKDPQTATGKQHPTYMKGDRAEPAPPRPQPICIHYRHTSSTPNFRPLPPMRSANIQSRHCQYIVPRTYQIPKQHYKIPSATTSITKGSLTYTQY